MPSTMFVDLSRWQFATTAAFPMTFPAISVGLAIFLAICHGPYYRTGNRLYLQMFRFWRKICAVSFAPGIVAGIVLTFELGLNWGNYARVTLVEQDSQLLSGTVADNLRLAHPDARADELLNALRVAVLADDVPLSARLGPGGEGLSGGQRRRLAIAQAYLRLPGLLLLDEPTEGLDRRTARTLLANLRSALPGTTIVAAIRDRMLDHLPAPADITIRLDRGRVFGGRTTD